jgi:Ca-activated chloride channel family protein
MRPPPILLLLALSPHHLPAQTTDQTPAYTLSVSANEVILTFHAADAHGLPVNDLKPTDITLLDNDKPPRKLLDFQLQHDSPIRAGILIDTSDSMQQPLPRDRAIATAYAQQLLRQQTDQAFVTEFGRLAKPLQSWTSNPAALTNAIRTVALGGAGPTHGTAIFDTLLTSCLNQFGQLPHTGTGNFILLFSDGEDNASFSNLKDAVDMCQRSNTAIYAFHAGPKSSADSSGPATLHDLTSQTGGRVFEDTDADTDIYADLRIIDANLRNQYRLVYRPDTLPHDGAFHRITLATPDRVATTTVRSGYYAPSH